MLSPLVHACALGARAQRDIEGLLEDARERFVLSFAPSCALASHITAASPRRRASVCIGRTGCAASSAWAARCVQPGWHASCGQRHHTARWPQARHTVPPCTHHAPRPPRLPCAKGDQAQLKHATLPACSPRPCPDGRVTNQDYVLINFAFQCHVGTHIPGELPPRPALHCNAPLSPGPPPSLPQVA